MTVAPVETALEVIAAALVAVERTGERFSPAEPHAAADHQPGPHDRDERQGAFPF